jgi:hypothetical protein
LTLGGTVLTPRTAGELIGSTQPRQRENDTMTKATGYVVLPYGGYPDTASDYVYCPTRATVEAKLVDFGWMANPAIHVYKITRGETAETVIAQLVASGDPYPDYSVEFGACGGVVWSPC